MSHLTIPAKEDNTALGFNLYKKQCSIFSSIALFNESFGIISLQCIEPGVLAWHAGRGVDGTVNDTKVLGVFVLMEPARGVWGIIKWSRTTLCAWTLSLYRWHPHTLSQGARTTTSLASSHFFSVWQTPAETKNVALRDRTIKPEMNSLVSQTVTVSVRRDST